MDPQSVQRTCRFRDSPQCRWSRHRHYRETGAGPGAASWIAPRRQRRSLAAHRSATFVTLRCPRMERPKSQRVSFWMMKTKFSSGREERLSNDLTPPVWFKSQIEGARAFAKRLSARWQQGGRQLLADLRRPARRIARSKPAGQILILTASKVVSISPKRAPALGQQRYLPKVSCTAVQQGELVEAQTLMEKSSTPRKHRRVAARASHSADQCEPWTCPDRRVRLGAGLALSESP